MYSKVLLYLHCKVTGSPEGGFQMPAADIDPRDLLTSWGPVSVSHSRSKAKRASVKSNKQQLPTPQRLQQTITTTTTPTPTTTHDVLPKKINTPKTTLRFIGFVAKISVLNPKTPGGWPVTQVNERIG